MVIYKSFGFSPEVLLAIFQKKFEKHPPEILKVASLKSTIRTVVANGCWILLGMLTDDAAAAGPKK
jgi:hypothetical protein